MIKPTIGRVVWFRESAGAKEQAAIVTYVWGDSMVNLVVFDGNGIASGRTSVILRQPEAETPQGSFCEWMPYQLA